MTVISNPTRTPRLLFLAHPFPPNSTSGCVRTWNTAKYLSRRGWEVTVVSPRASVWKITEPVQAAERRLAEEEVRCIRTGHRWAFLAPDNLKASGGPLHRLLGGVCRKAIRHLGIDNGIGWIGPALRACREESLNPDVILATGRPFAAFPLARRLSRRLGCPYVLDYRDPWTGNPHAPVAPPAWVGRLEGTLLRDAAAATIVSPSWAELLRRQFRLGNKLQVISNGFDPEELQDVPSRQFDHPALVYAGNLYPPKRMLGPVFSALASLPKTIGWKFHYYGIQQELVSGEADRYSIADRLVLHGRVPRSECLAAAKGAALSLVVTSIDPEAEPADRGIVTGKIFEILGLGSRLLLIAPPGNDAVEIVRRTGSGGAFSGSDQQGISDFLASELTRRGRPPARLEDYSWPVLSGKLDRLLRNAAFRIPARQPRSRIVEVSTTA